MMPNEIKKLRQNFNCRQVEFARILGITPAALSRWENGNAIPSKTNIEQLEFLKKILKQENSEIIKQKLLFISSMVNAGIVPGGNMTAIGLFMNGFITAKYLLRKILKLFGSDGSLGVKDTMDYYIEAEREAKEYKNKDLDENIHDVS